MIDLRTPVEVELMWFGRHLLTLRAPMWAWLGASVVASVAISAWIS